MLKKAKISAEEQYKEEQQSMPGTETVPGI